MYTDLKKIPKLNIDSNRPLDQIVQVLDEGLCLAIDKVNWLGFETSVRSMAYLAYSENALYIRFDVSEPAVVANKTQTNEMVCLDSCVECFLLSSTGDYYNIEMNAIGTVLVGLGPDRHSRNLLPNCEAERIRTWSSLGKKAFGLLNQATDWQLVCEIPKDWLLDAQSATLESERVLKLNLYKCGEELPDKHYLTWAPIPTPQPDFHRPEFFQELVLA